MDYALKFNQLRNEGQLEGLSKVTYKRVGDNTTAKALLDGSWVSAEATNRKSAYNDLRKLIVSIKTGGRAQYSSPKARLFKSGGSYRAEVIAEPSAQSRITVSVKLGTYSDELWQPILAQDNTEEVINDLIDRLLTTCLSHSMTPPVCSLLEEMASPTTSEGLPST